MGQSALLFLLMNLWGFSVCQNYVYHFINESKSWKDAQNFCRKYYSDLATVKNMKDLEDLEELKRVKGDRPDAWIGLYNLTGANRTWHWSLPGLEYTESKIEERSRWHGSEPNDVGGPENCVYIDKPKQNKQWQDDGCEADHCFICYNNGSVVLNDTCVNWTTAQQICRENNGDLISGLEQLDTHLNSLLNNANCRCTTPNQWWIGLFRDRWGWSDGSNSSFRNWRRDDGILNKNYKHDKKDCVKVGPQGAFIRDDCTQPHHFICYDELFILVKVNKTFEQALTHCRKNYRELAWFMDHEHLKRMVEARAKMADSEVVWVGLYYTCFLESWIWVNGHYVSDTDKNWEEPGASECGVAGALKRSGDNKWVKRKTWEEHNFICVR